MSNKSILILGLPKSSKTVFITQFHSRLIKNRSAITLYESVKNITPIIDSRERLANGEEPEPTSPEKYVELILPIKVNGEKFDLTYPDFGGEQIEKIVEERIIDRNWSKALKQSNNWLLFIRLNSLTSIYDLSNKTFDKESLTNIQSNATTEFQKSDQSFFIELLQIMLDLKNNNQHLKNDSIKLNIVLTCWDELNTKDTPAAKLAQELPLLLDFIKANWKETHYQIFGLSSQGFSLDTEENKEKYRDEGPENFGFLINPDGSEVRDITQLISEAL